MKNNFYVHGTNNLIDLKQQSEILNTNWNERYNLPNPESSIYHEIYNRKDYIKGDCKITPGGVVIDCGGNIGVFSSFALDMGAYRVLSFEPFVDNYILNKKNNPDAEVFNLAVSDKTDEYIELLYTHTGNGGHTTIESEIERDPNHYQHKNIYVKTITLDDIIKRNFIDHVDFLKVDTEGSELKIFNGISDENLNKINSIAIEYHHSVFNFDDDIYTNFQKRFNNLGFNTYTWIMDKYCRMLYINKGDVFKD